MRRKNSPTSKPEIIELTIDSLSYFGGRGVGRFDGIVVFVGDVVPGDRVRVRTTHKKSRLWEAELLEVLVPSPHRRVPPCPVALRCGGCSWQQVTYDIQVEQKVKILRDSLRGLVKYGPWSELEFDRAPDEFHYRNRIQVHFRGGSLGFFAKRSRDLVPTRECWIADSRLNAELKTLTAMDGSKIEVALTETGEVRVMPGERDPEAALFAQVNEAQNEVLKKRLLEVIDGGEPARQKLDWAMDLYAGSGNLTLPLARKLPGVPILAVELSREAIERAENQSHPASATIEWLAEDVAVALAQRRPRGGQGLIVLDPPRAGLMPQVVDGLLLHVPEQIIYVSCNPSTFARDAERLVQAGKYELKSVRGLDMFPQTEHVELIADLRRKRG